MVKDHRGDGIKALPFPLCTRPKSSASSSQSPPSLTSTRLSLLQLLVCLTKLYAATLDVHIDIFLTHHEHCSNLMLFEPYSIVSEEAGTRLLRYALERLLNLFRLSDLL